MLFIWFALWFVWYGLIKPKSLFKFGLVEVEDEDEADEEEEDDELGSFPLVLLLWLVPFAFTPFLMLLLFIRIAGSMNGLYMSCGFIWLTSCCGC